MSKENKPLVYIPPGAKINVENKNDDPPPTRYERRKFVFQIDNVKKFVKGFYGKRDD
jgi:hypothetical protein